MKRFKSISRTAKIVTIGATVALTLGIAGTAFAYFTSTGSGTGQAAVGTATKWNVVAGAATGGPMFPGAGTSTVPFTVTNAGTGAQAYTTLTPVVASSGLNITQNGNALSGCLASWFTPVLGTPSVAAGTSIAGGGSFTVSVSVTMTNAATSQNACAGATPDITLDVS
ncbi:MAG: hypothetical protein ACLP81_09440 [Acidimicrobiales bacterium]